MRLERVQIPSFLADCGDEHPANVVIAIRNVILDFMAAILIVSRSQVNAGLLQQSK